MTPVASTRVATSRSKQFVDFLDLGPDTHKPGLAFGRRAVFMASAALLSTLGCLLIGQQDSVPRTYSLLALSYQALGNGPGVRELLRRTGISGACYDSSANSRSCRRGKHLRVHFSPPR